MKAQWAVVRLVGSCAFAVVSSFPAAGTQALGMHMAGTLTSSEVYLTSHRTEARARGQAQQHLNSPCRMFGS